MTRVELTFARADRCVVVRVTGEVDIATVSTLDEGFRDAFASAPHAVICDLRGVTFLAAAGLHCLERAVADCKSIGSPLHLVLDRESRIAAILRWMPVSGCRYHFSVDEAVHDASSSLADS